MIALCLWDIIDGSGIVGAHVIATAKTSVYWTVDGIRFDAVQRRATTYAGRLVEETIFEFPRHWELKDQPPALRCQLYLEAGGTLYAWALEPFGLPAQWYSSP
jgi:hypothetical protein